MHLGHIPDDGEQFTIEQNNIVFTIEEVKDKRVESVKIKIKK